MKSPFGNMSNILKQAQATAGADGQSAVNRRRARRRPRDCRRRDCDRDGQRGPWMPSVKIDPEVVKAGDVDMLQDLVVAASNDVRNHVR